MPYRRAIAAVLMACLLISAAACSNCVPVEGVVTLDGKPVDGATVVFLPLENSSRKDAPRHASAKTSPEGRFALETHDQRGAIPGTYRVTVSKKVAPPGTKLPTTIAEMAAYGRKMTESLPKAYTGERTTPLQIEVPKGGDKNLQIELTTK